MPSSAMQESLGRLLCCLKAQYWLFQHCHWASHGTGGYGDHLLFQRLYEDVQGDVDGLAEKLTGYFGNAAIEPGGENLDGFSAWVSRWVGSDAPEGLHERGLLAEEDFQAVAKATYEELKASGEMTLGLDDWIMSVCNSHETHTYLLKQVLSGRLDSRTAANQFGIEAAWRQMGFLHIANPGPKAHPIPDMSAEGHFFDRPRSREVREFAESGAVSNVSEVSTKSVETSANATGTTSREERAAVKETPPTPVEILKEVPGSGEFSTLSRYLVQTEEPTDPGVPQSRDDIPKVPDLIKTSGWTFARREA